MKPEVIEEVLSQLERMNPIELGLARGKASKTLGLTKRDLDKALAARRKSNATPSDKFDHVVPWSEPVVPSQLLDDILGTIKRFIVCSDETACAATLWAAMTWFIEVIQTAPLAVITAPEKRCGKTQLLSLLAKLVRRPLPASNISPSAMFRSIDAWRPTLLIDEADAFMKENEELRGVVNCGHTRDSAFVIRNVGENHEPRPFNVWGAKALAGIGHLSDTVMDRSIILELRRRLPNECAERLRYAEDGLFSSLASKLARFAQDYAESLRLARPKLPEKLNDRAQDNWEPLLGIADLAGGHWPELARKAAVTISGGEVSYQCVGNELLSDIKEIFEIKNMSRISSADLIAALCEDPEKPWATYNRGKPISYRQVAKRLSEYGISSKNIRFGVETLKGFELAQFQETFDRYLGSPPENYRYTPQNDLTLQNEALFPVADLESRLLAKTLSATRKPVPDAGCVVVADKKREMGEGKMFYDI